MWFSFTMEATRLAALPLFSSLAPADLESVAAAVRELDAPPGSEVVSEGDFGHAPYVIESGSAEVVRSGIVIAALGPGDVFGEIAVSASGRRVATVRATSQMRLVMLFSRDLWRLEKEHPEIAASLRRSIDQRLAELNSK
jgi:CRP/FNR family transcriptional regulator, cyclic AMP receptor protein